MVIHRMIRQLQWMARLWDRGRGVQNMMAGGDAGQHKTQVNNALPITGTTSLSGRGTLTFAPRDAKSSRSYKHAHRVQQTFYQAPGKGWSIAGNSTSTSDTPAAAAP